VGAALRAFGEGDGGVRVRDVARRVGLSDRRFIEVFRAEVGMTPKAYSRVRRFQRALAAARAVGAGRPEWARVAAACGYFDQSHLVHDFREFSGFGPAECLRQFRVPAKQNHVPVVG
jgi:transcriptional regulator GlxA family with amidase domain